MTPEELYKVYRYDEPTRVSQDAIRSGLKWMQPTPESIPVIEQCMPRSALKNAVIHELNETKRIEHERVHQSKRPGYKGRRKRR